MLLFNFAQGLWKFLMIPKKDKQISCLLNCLSLRQGRDFFSHVLQIQTLPLMRRACARPNLLELDT